MIRRSALIAASLFLTSAAQADNNSTTGLWPDVSVPVTGATSTAASKDAAVIIGIERYDALPRIRGAADNARDWEKYMLFGRHVPPERVSLLTDQNATADAISARVKETAGKVQQGGTLFVVFIGHGAPADGGAKGLLLGADTRPSDASFASRALSYEQLVSLAKGGSQDQTVLVLDACFSGVSNEGKTLLGNVQPVIATSLVAQANVTTFSAGTAAEYAGALPGSQRPALSYLMLGGLRGWADANDDGNITPAEINNYAGLVLRSLPNNHEQHPQLVTAGDDKPLAEGAKEKGPDLATIRSKLDTWHPVIEEGPMLRVAVGCVDASPRSPEEGLSVSIDDTPTVAPSTRRKKWDPKTNRNEVDYVAYPASVGRHHVVVRIPGCETMDTDIEVGNGGGDLTGALRSDAALLVRGPAGNPNWGRASLAAWFPSMSSNHGARTNDLAMPEFGDRPDMRPGAAGIMASAAVLGRWWIVGADIGYASGSVKLEGDFPNKDPKLRDEYGKADMQWFRADIKAGVRFPFHSAAVMVGVQAGYDAQDVDFKAPFTWAESNAAFTGGWVGVDAHVFCDWPIFGGVTVDGRIKKVLEYDSVITGIQIGVAYQPNSVCKAERSTQYGLRGSR